MIGDEPNPPYGEVNCLRYEYERSRTDQDPHPNMAANQVAGPLFAQFIERDKGCQVPGLHFWSPQLNGMGL